MADKNELILNEELPEDAVYQEDIETVFSEDEPPDSSASSETKRLVVPVVTTYFSALKDFKNV